jgi:predicted  nucleic acid-binding Zn-ribbon protein
MLIEVESVARPKITMNSDEAETQETEILCQRLLRQQPQARPLLERLLARSDRAFAIIRDGRCSACNVTIATARAQMAKIGAFINCANCSRFLYCPAKCYGPCPADTANPTFTEQQSTG